MSDGTGALHPLAAIGADLLGIPVRWSMKAGLEEESALVLVEYTLPTPTLILGGNDPYGDSTAITLTPGQAEELRDALTAWLDEP